jgi:hypothetical protein
MIKYTVEVYDNGDKSWRLNGKLHREDGPAVEYANGDKSWWLNDEFHREDGPAIEYANGDKLWYLNGNELTEEEHKKAMNPPKPSCEGKEVEIGGITYILKEKTND